MVRTGTLKRHWKAAILAELERILQSEHFRDSKRCQDFLGHVVHMALKGRKEEINEREIGIAVFGREPAYNTSEDAIVRVKANDVRKRLAEYKLTHGHSEIQIGLPRGAYVPEFEWTKAATEKQPAGPAVRRWVVVIVVGALILAVSWWAWFAGAQASSALEKFWAPVLSDTKPVLICLAHPVVYHLSARVHKQFQARSPASRGPYAITLNPKDILGEDVISIPDQYVGAGDAQAAIFLSSMLKGFGKLSQVRIGYDVSFSELRKSPTILIGAFTNRWTLDVMNDLRFVFEFRDGVKIIRDRLEGKTWFIPNLGSTGRVSIDYLLVSRIFESKSGQMIISGAGITQYGTQAAGEFLCQPASLETALRSVSADWPRRNLQFVLQTTVIDSTAAPAKVLVTHIW